MTDDLQGKTYYAWGQVLWTASLDVLLAQGRAVLAPQVDPRGVWLTPADYAALRRGVVEGGGGGGVDPAVAEHVRKQMGNCAHCGDGV